MQGSNRRIAKNTLILYVRMLFTMVLGLYTSRLVLNTLGVTDYGIYNVVGGIITLLGFINNSMSSASSRFLTFELGTGNIERQKKVFGQSLFIHLLIAILVAFLGETIGLWFVYEKINIPVERFFSAIVVYHVSVATAFFNIICVPYSALIIAHEKMRAFAYITILDAVLKLVILFVLMMLPYDKLIIYSILLFIVQILIQIIYISYSLNNFQESKNWFAWDRCLFREMFSFACWSMFGNLAVTLFSQGLNVLINIFFGPAVNAARGIAVQVQGLVGRFIENFQMALNPQITKQYASGEIISMHRLIFMSSKYSFFLMMLLSLPLLINTDYVLRLWLKTVPEYTVIFVRIMLFISIMGTLSNPLIVSAQATGRIRVYQQVVGGILLGILPVAYIFLKSGAPVYSVFIVHLVFTLIAHCARVYMIRPMIKLSIREYVHKVVIRVCGVLIFSATISIPLSMLHEGVSFITFMLDTLICMIVSLIVIFYIGMDKVEKEFLILKFKEVIRKF